MSGNQLNKMTTQNHDSSKTSNLTRAWLRGAKNAPLPIIRDSSNMDRAIDFKLGRPSPASISHRTLKKNSGSAVEIFLSYGRFCDVTTADFLAQKQPIFLSLSKTHFLTKMQMKNAKRRKLTSSTRWLSRFFKILSFWPPKLEIFENFGFLPEKYP